MAMQITEASIFNHEGNTIKTEDREIHIITKIEEPCIAVLGNVLSTEECEELIRISKDNMNRSKIGSHRDISDIRTSIGTFLPEIENDVVSRVEKRVSQIVNVPVEHGEGLHILNYKVGQEYKAHLDYFTSTNKTVNNPRISTLVMYLNDVEEGGETYFPHLNLSVEPKQGMAVYFEYFYQDPSLNELTLHGGSPVIVGEKWAATQWIRRQQYR
ncbi:2OG-Fe(II) oxygenase [Pontibacillus yanchengensis]|uniref:2OG-Fe(II) oxygenase n=1 Tax=Pontibacillus yanchengensis TaxID=462910 RepID=A0A6I5A479_9BACI|nr:2OG-Fe(II) oxygenase [Pontibacillus yanchengensis]MYL34949.1 2OG-Fe(II) oxygenase [Pontibacillus yanchengensis]